MTIGMKARIILAGGLSAAVLTVTAAQACESHVKLSDTSGVSVCNQATARSLGGNMLATDGDNSPAARFQSNLKAKPGNGVGQLQAALHSMALTLCQAPADDGSSNDVSSNDGSTDPTPPSTDPTGTGSTTTDPGNSIPGMTGGLT